MNLPLSTAFTESHRFSVIVFLFSFISTDILISFWISSVICYSEMDDTTLMAESEEELSLLMKVKEESEKVSFKLNIQNTKIMVSGPITHGK